MKRVVAALLTMIVMALMVWTALSQSRSSRNAAHVLIDDDPRFHDSRSAEIAKMDGTTACIESLLSSARAGDVAKYLSAFTGPLRDRLAREADEIGRDAFAQRLRQASMCRKSHAIFAPEPLGTGLEGAWITAESAYTDRIERQRFRLERSSSGWLVTEIETAREHVPKARLGSLATYQEPEGPPVAAIADEPGSERNRK